MDKFENLLFFLLGTNKWNGDVRKPEEPFPAQYVMYAVFFLMGWEAIRISWLAFIWTFAVLSAVNLALISWRVSVWEKLGVEVGSKYRPRIDITKLWKKDDRKS